MPKAPQIARDQGVDGEESGDERRRILGQRKPPAERQTAEPHGEAELQQQAEEEARHRDRAERDDARHVVRPAVAIDGRHQAGGNADDDGEQHRREDEFERRRQIGGEIFRRPDAACRSRRPSRRAAGRWHSSSIVRRSAGRDRTPCHRRRSRRASHSVPRPAPPDRPAAAARSRRRDRQPDQHRNEQNDASQSEGEHARSWITMIDEPSRS